MTTPTFTSVGDEKFVSLTTFRRSGEAVATPVWVAPDAGALVVTTQRESGKVKRIRHTPRVELRACTVRGAVEAGADPVVAVAEVRTDEATHEQAHAALARKYGLQYRLIHAVERLTPGKRSDRVILRITES